MHNQRRLDLGFHPRNQDMVLEEHHHIQSPLCCRHQLAREEFMLQCPDHYWKHESELTPHIKQLLRRQIYPIQVDNEHANICADVGHTLTMVPRPDWTTGSPHVPARDQRHQARGH